MSGFDGNVYDDTGTWMWSKYREPAEAEQNLIMSDHRGITMDTSRFTLG